MWDLGGYGVGEWNRGMEKEGCAILLSKRMWEGLEDYGWKGTRITWAKTRVDIIKYA